ncbi:FMN-binding negative transcriptional regulator [Pedobacter faecalis]|uniref:FMN-binding negative transcriptional regulator n=1 Tax=Pedobacter faecalis TaxID=3041495 RepID=UPI00254C77AE|nr:FMN-binding negative transcriptional regulator [Pedobacter sp. ELA7]
MYVAKLNQISDQEEIVSFMKRFTFATIISAIGQVPQATHLPFTVVYKDGIITLHAHFAKANPQWKNIEDQKVLVVFAEPHAYISPKHYDKFESVPTWNYYAVHAYGDCVLVQDRAEALRSLEDMIMIYEAEYKSHWDSLSDSFKDKMLNGIVAFSVKVTEIQASQKMSQNKTVEEQKRIIDTLQASDLSSEKAMGEYMALNLEKKIGS